MLRSFIIIGVIWFVSRFAGDVDYPHVYETLVKLNAAHDPTFFIASLAGIFSLVLVAGFFSVLKLHSVMYLFSKLFLEINQLLVCGISFFAVVIWFDLHRNLWMDFGKVTLLPYAGLLTSCFCLRMFDFNYPVQDRIVNNTAAMLGSIVVVFIAGVV